jgi:hypothetical protein
LEAILMKNLTDTSDNAADIDYLAMMADVDMSEDIREETADEDE